MYSGHEPTAYEQKAMYEKAMHDITEYIKKVRMSDSPEAVEESVDFEEARICSGANFAACALFPEQCY